MSKARTITDKELRLALDIKEIIGTEIQNNETNERYVVLDITTCEKRVTTRYKLQHIRFKFDTFLIDYATFNENLETGVYEVKE